MKSDSPKHGESGGTDDGGAATSPDVEHNRPGRYAEGNLWYDKPNYDGDTSNRFGFDAVLMSSRVYRNTRSDTLDASLRGSDERSARLSAFSELSLADISTYHVVDAPVPWSAHLALEKDTTLDAVSPQINDGRAPTVADSGYGTASKAATDAALHPVAHRDTDFSDDTSVITDNLSLDLAEDVGDVYVKEFVERILDAMDKLPTQEVHQEQLVRMLPDLLRAFALRVSFAEKTAAANGVGVFTRKNRQ